MKPSILKLTRESSIPKLFGLLLIAFFACKAPVANAQLISNVVAHTGNPYAVSKLNNNVLIYTDRTYRATSVPSILVNAAFIKTPNDDKASKTSLSFKLSQNSTVYIGYDPRATALPTWLSTWKKLTPIIKITDPDIPHFVLYSKSFSAGTVTIGGNVASPAAGVKNMSIIIAVPATIPKTPPTVKITSPANNSTIIANTVTINATAADADGTVSKVEFYKGTTFLGSDNVSPYSFKWNNVVPGSYSLTAKATDNSGLATKSAVISIKVTIPVLAITSPAPNSSYQQGATIPIVATARDSISVQRVELYSGATLMNSQFEAPFGWDWVNAPAGNFTLKAIAYNKDGSSDTSAGVPIKVIASTSYIHPSVVSVNPVDKATNVSEYTSISTNVLKLPNGGIDNNSISSATAYITENSTGALVSSKANGTGGGDGITLVPSAALKFNTTYKVNITAGVKDLTGTSFVPYTSTFTTKASTVVPPATIQFEKVSLPTATGNHTSITIGPDNKLYALSDDGIIKRFTINADGTLSTPQLIYSLQDSYGATRRKTLAIGLTFDPSSTASNLIVWITHCNAYVFVDAPDWNGKLTRLNGPNLENARDVLVHLPRSAKDHVPNSIAFGPDSALYFTQPSNSAMGLGDQTWGYRGEHLLNAAILRLDLKKVGSATLDVQTIDSGGLYNPFAANAPLTIYASGIRNAYDLVWHSNGNLYVAANGSAAGGNTPASVKGTRRPDGSLYNGPAVPSLINVQQTQEDFLFRIVKGGYYGHPNPSRGEYVMNGGNPTSSKDIAELPAYPIGTLPDANWRGSIFNFKNNVSPNGTIEYKSNSFGGALKGKLLVVRYSAHDDIIVLTPGGTNGSSIVSYTEGPLIPGFSGFVDPLDITEDRRTGNLYVSEYGGSKITLLKPTTKAAVSASRSSSSSVIISNTPVNVVSGCDAGIDVTVATDDQASVIKTIKPKINPNPVRDKFQVQFPRTYKGDYTLQLVDISGKIYQVGKINLKGGENMQVNISRLSLKAGTYFLRLLSESNEREEAFKLILVDH